MANINLPIETKVREFDGKLWLAINLAKRGHTISLGERDRRATIDTLNSDITIETSTAHSTSYFDILLQTKENGCKVGILDTEGGVFTSEEEYFKSRISEEILELVDIVFTWGEIPADIIRKKTSFPEERIYVTGNPRFDLLLPKLRGIYSQPAKEISKGYGDIILVNTNFTSGNPFSEEKYKEIQTNWGKDIRENEKRYQEELIQKFIEAVKALSQDIPSHTIIIRPHPSENHEFYREKFRETESVVVDHSGDVRSWIYASECVIHNGCTTGIEAALLNKPVIAYEPEVQGPTTERPPLPNTVSQSVYSLQELLHQVKNYISQESHYEMSLFQTTELEKYFANVKQPAAPKIAEAVSEIDDLVTHSPDSDIPLKRRFELWVKNQPIAPLLKQLQKSVGGRSVYRLQKFPGLPIEEVKHRLCDFENQIGETNIEVYPINNFDDIYWIKQN